MPGHRPYALELRRRMVELVRNRGNRESVGEEYERSAQSIRKWVRQGERDAGRRADGMTSEEKGS